MIETNFELKNLKANSQTHDRHTSTYCTSQVQKLVDNFFICKF